MNITKFKLEKNGIQKHAGKVRKNNYIFLFKTNFIFQKNIPKLNFSQINNFQAIQESDVDFMLDELDRLGHDL